MICDQCTRGHTLKKSWQSSERSQRLSMSPQLVNYVLDPLSPSWWNIYLLIQTTELCSGATCLIFRCVFFCLLDVALSLTYTLRFDDQS